MKKSTNVNAALRISGSRPMTDSYSFIACKQGKDIYSKPKGAIY
jgi:hypothetical protein